MTAAVPAEPWPCIAVLPPIQQVELLDECLVLVSRALQCCATPAHDSVACAAQLLGPGIHLHDLTSTLRFLLVTLDAKAPHLPQPAPTASISTSSHHLHPVHRVLGSLLAAAGHTDHYSARFERDSIDDALDALTDFARQHPTLACDNIDSLLATILMLAHHTKEHILRNVVALAPCLRDSIALYRIVANEDGHSLVPLLIDHTALRRHMNALIQLTTQGANALPPPLSGIGQAIADMVADTLPARLARLLAQDAMTSSTLVCAEARLFVSTIERSGVLHGLLPWRGHDGLRALVRAMACTVPAELEAAYPLDDLRTLMVSVQRHDGEWCRMALVDALHLAPPSGMLVPPGSSQPVPSPGDTLHVSRLIAAAEDLLAQSALQEQPPAPVLPTSAHDVVPGHDKMPRTLWHWTGGSCGLTPTRVGDTAGPSMRPHR